MSMCLLMKLYNPSRFIGFKHCVEFEAHQTAGVYDHFIKPSTVANPEPSTGAYLLEVV